MPEGACRGSTRKGGRAAEVSRPSSVSSLGALGPPMASDPLSGSCTSMNTLCSDSDRPASLSSSASSASLQDQPGAFGSSSGGGGLGGCPTAYPHQNGSDISLDLTPVALLDGAAEGQGRWSPSLARAREPRAKKHSHLERVVQEIVETEQAYVRDLRSLVEDYLGCIIDCGKLPLKPEQVGTLFCNIEDIYEFNSELLANMQRHPSPHAVAECFVQRSEEFDIYTLYCMNYPSSISLLRQCMEDEVLAKFFRERQATLSHSLPLETYLLKPVQRILKYHLLLQELAKHYDKSSPGYDTVEEASITMTAVAWYINDMKRKQEQSTRLQEIQGLLVGWNGPELGAFGELILEGQFRVPRVRKERVFFLLSKVILITKRRGEAFIYKSHIFCCNLALQEATKDPLSFKISDLSIPKHQHLVQVRNQEEKRLWVHYLKHLIVENHPGSIPQKAKQVLLENSFQGAPEGLRSSEAPKRPLPSPRLEERQACTRNRRQSEPPEFMYSPERARRSCPILALEKSASCRQDHRRKSEPVKEFQTLFHPKNVSKFEAGDEVCSRHIDSDCHLCPPPRPPTDALASGRAETGAAESDQDEGEAEFLLPEEAIPSGLSITEEILELLSQRGLDKEARKDGNFPEGGSHREDQPLPNSVLEEQKEEAEEEEEEGESRLGPSLEDAPHLLPDSFRPEPPPRLHPHFAGEDSSEDEEQLLRPQEGGSSSPSPLHVLETLAPEEDSGRAEEATGWEPQTPQDTDRSACSPQSALAQRSPEETTGVKAGGRAGRGPPLTKSDWLLMEKIRSYYEAAEHARKVPEGPGRKESGPPVPTGVVRESILHFNNIWRKSDGHEWEVGEARLRKPHPPTGPSSRSRSRSCHGQEEGGNWPAGSPELSMRGRSSSEGGAEHPATISGEDSRQGWSQTGEAEQERSCLEGSGGGRDLEEEEEPPSGPEFKSCAEIRRAWQEKERIAMVMPKKGCRGPMNGGSPSPPEMAIYAEPLYIVEDSDLEDPPAPSVSKGDPEQTAGSKGRLDGEKGPDEPPLPSLGLYGLPQEDPCLLETSERIFSKVQALAKMYSEKIHLLKAPESPMERKKKPRVRPHPSCGPRAPSGSLATAQQEEEKPGANLPHCEPRIYGHIFIHEPFHHVVGVQEKTALVTATRGTALELRSTRPPPLLPPDLLGPLRQEPPRHPPGFHSTTEETHPVPDLPGSPSPTLSAEHHMDLPPWAQDRGPPSGPRLAAKATLGDTQAEDMRWTTVVLDRETGEAGQPPHRPGIRPEASATSGMPGLLLGSRPSPLGHEGPKACRVSGPVEEAKDLGPHASSAGSFSLQKPEGPPPPPWLPCRPSHVEAGSQAKGEGPAERGGSRREEMTKEGHPREEPGGNRAEAPHGHPVPGPPKAGTPPTPPPPMPGTGAAVEPPPPPVVSAPGQRPSLPFPKLLPPSPVRRCLSSSAAALSRYIAASCISQSLAKRNGIPALEETQGTLQGFPPGGALADPLALLPKAAPRARGRGGAPGASLRPSSTRPPTAALAAAQAFEPPARLASASAPNSRAQSPSLVKPRLCSPPPPPSVPPAHAFTPLGAHLLHRQLPSHVHSPVPLRPDQGRRAPATPPSPLDNGPPDSGLTHSPAANGDRGSSGHMPGLAPCPSAQDLSGLRWPEGPGFCLRERNQEQGRLSPPLRPPLDGEGCHDPGSPPSGDGARPADRSPLHPRASYSTTVNIRIGGSGRIASFSNAQVSLTTPEPLSLRKVHGSPMEGTPKT